MGFRNPRPLGVVRDHQGLPEGLPMLYYLNCPHSEKGYSMSRFIKIAHVLWHCQVENDEHFCGKPYFCSIEDFHMTFRVEFQFSVVQFDEPRA